jgi:hypothetical protein
MQEEVPIQQILHDLANVVQTLTFALEEKPVDISVISVHLERLSFLIKIYSQIYSVLDYTTHGFTDLIELIQESKGQPIELLGNPDSLPKLVKRILLLYLTWTRSEVTVNIEPNTLTIVTQDKPIRIRRILLEQMLLNKEVQLEDYPDQVRISWV